MRVANMLWLVGMLAGAAQAQSARVEIPILQSHHADGRLNYTVMITVGNSAPIQTTLDSGSTGLRILPGVLGPQDVEAGVERSTYSYASGAQLTGLIGHGVVKMGDAVTNGPVAIDIITAVGCRDDSPHCPASRTDINSFGFAGDGIPGKGFHAIMGVGLASADADNPLAAIGDGVWIIELPRPSDTAPGRLILNPSPDERASFTIFHIARDRATIPGCILNLDNKAHVCGQVLLDTGQPGMFVTGHDRPDSFPWADGAHAALLMQDDDGAKIGAEMIIHQTPGSPLSLHARQGMTSFYRIAGSAPFFAFDVLFDSKAREIGLKARAPQ